MTKDDIIRMAEESTPDHMIGGCEFDYAQLEHFAKLVAAAEREECAQVVEQAGIDGYGTLAAALLIRERGAP
jgi:hypothetical protein